MRNKSFGFFCISLAISLVLIGAFIINSDPPGIGKIMNIIYRI